MYVKRKLKKQHNATGQTTFLNISLQLSLLVRIQYPPKLISKIKLAGVIPDIPKLIMYMKTNYYPKDGRQHCHNLLQTQRQIIAQRWLSGKSFP